MLKREYCRECRDLEPSVFTPAEFILWGKLFPREALGPRCYEHAASHISPWGMGRIEEYAVYDLRLVNRFEDLLVEERHVIQFGNGGWTVAHPLNERINGTLFDCKVHWDWDDPGVRGKFWLEYDEDGVLVLGDKVPS